MASRKSSRKRASPVKRSSPLENKGVRIGIIFVFIIVVVVAAYYVMSGNNESGDEVINGDNETIDDNNGEEVTENSIAVIDTTMGTIKVELFEDKVPNTCENFIKLVNDGFYSGLVFHRVIDDFMIQGGGFNPDGTTKESPYGTINLEIDPEVRHVDGAIAMARTTDPNSATNQFYICDGAQSFLDDEYAAFGIVTEGIDIVRSIAAVDTTTKYQFYQDWPVEDVIINSITIENQ